ncbi:prepilin peptidase-dependent pilin [Rosenbergiella collisarenosi]|uniref:prepilin peptidase-dependent pilin n=1 Tax=Rosenbergiella collisarenosi TaxID=1544695 RepID=UPI001F4F5B82|nr:prepilin peptidase-dependent pilin [Rosenbergiella collisarenosi]
MEQGFTLIELMIVIAIIAILSSLGIPAYQGYLQKAALTDLLQVLQPYKIAVELCALEKGQLDVCQAGQEGIPLPRTTRYISELTVNNGVIRAQGTNTLNGLNAELIPILQAEQGSLSWQRRCQATNSTLRENCERQLRYDDRESKP